MNKFNKKVDSIIDWLTEPDGGNAVIESDIREAIVESKELRKFDLLDLPDVMASDCFSCEHQSAFNERCVPDKNGYCVNYEKQYEL